MKLILYLSSQGLDVYRSDGKGIECLATFSSDTQGQQDFATFLQDMPKAPCHILADLIEEEFREELLPHTLGRDRAALHGRHAARLFRATPFRCSRVLGRRKSGRKDDQVLFCALTNPDAVEPWLGILADRHMPLAGIHSLPLLTGQLVKPLGARSANMLVITEQNRDALRETFIKDGQVQFSRLAPLPDGGSSIFGGLLGSEVDKIRRYLHTLKLFGRDESLDVFVISGGSRLASARAHCQDTELVCFQYRDVHEVARSLGFAAYPHAYSCEALFVYLLAKRRVSNHYAQGTHRRGFFTWQLRHALGVATVATAAAGLLWSGLNLADGLLLDRQTQAIRAQLGRAEERYRQAAERLPDVGVTAADILAAVNIADRLQGRRSDPGVVLSTIGQALAQRPGLVPDKLQWFTSTDPDARDAGAATRAAQLSGDLDRPLYTIALVSGHISDFDGSWLNASQRIERLASHLTARPQVRRVDIVREPLDTRHGGNVEGEVDSRHAPGRAYFTLRIVMESSDGAV